MMPLLLLPDWRLTSVVQRIARRVWAALQARRSRCCPCGEHCACCPNYSAEN
jgi:hypothetical protein